MARHNENKFSLCARLAPKDFGDEFSEFFFQYLHGDILGSVEPLFAWACVVVSEGCGIHCLEDANGLFHFYSYICSVKGIKSILATVSLLTFVVSFAAFVVSVFAGFYGSLAWLGIISFVSFFAMLIVAGTPDNATYLRNRRR